LYIKRVQIDEGFLDGVDAYFSSGLNVIIGARGTGKTSLIELIRYCLDVESYTNETGKKSREHALSVLGGGQVTVTLSDENEEIKVTRGGDDELPRFSSAYVKPIIFSQTEIESVGLKPNGRLQLLDSFAQQRKNTSSKEKEIVAYVKSLTFEANSLRKEIEGFDDKLSSLPIIEKEIEELSPQEKQVSALSEQAGVKKSSLNNLSEKIAAASVEVDRLQRFRKALKVWESSLVKAHQDSAEEKDWSDDKEFDPLAKAKRHVQKAHAGIESSLKEIASATKEVEKLIEVHEQEKIELEGQSRELRKEIERLQEGAGAVARKGQQLREKKAQLESLKELSVMRKQQLKKLLEVRNKKLDELDEAREERFNARLEAAHKLNQVLGPRIKIDVTRAGQYDDFNSEISEALRGSGLRYNDLAPLLAESISPRELLEVVEAYDYDALAKWTGISKDRAGRVINQLGQVDLGALSVTPVEDFVEFKLLDGADYKDILELSTGQRCTVILPLVLQHTDRLLIVDQPEDHIDNAFIAETLIKSVLSRDKASQIVFSTHNANIPVLGDADQVVQMGSDGKRGFLIASSGLQDPKVVNAITTVMEGGEKAFSQRAEFYNKHKYL